jgi:hypothetical protein
MTLPVIAVLASCTMRAASIFPTLRLLPWVVMAACGHSAGTGLKPMVDTPILPFKAPDSDAIADITGIDADDEAAILAGSAAAAGSAGAH